MKKRQINYETNCEITAQRLKEALSAADMKPSELSERSGVSKASISQYVNGTVCPSNISASKMAQVLGVSPLWLMDLSDDREPTRDSYAKFRVESYAKLLQNSKLQELIEVALDSDVEDMQFAIDILKKMKK